MTVRNLEKLMAPKSVALIGASAQPHSVGSTTAKNLLAGGFAGPLYFVNPKYAEIMGTRCYRDVEALPEAPDLAIIAAPPKAVPGVIDALGRRGTKAAVVITAGMAAFKQEMLAAAKPYLLRILGPNCLGLILPRVGLNGSFAHRMAPKGDLAFLSQSGALVTAVIDWAGDRNVGFSHVVSIGDMADVDFGDLLDYLAGDTQSHAILIYMEALTHAPKFISAARRAARVKPVIVVKSGRHEAGAKAAMSHTGALAGSDAAYEAAFRRTGLLRVNTLPELFASAEMLARGSRLKGERLAILTNGGGAGVLAADELQDAAGVLATLSSGTIARLDKTMPPAWSRGNPIDIIGDAGPERYRSALAALIDNEDGDAILAIQCPTALASSIENAHAVIDVIEAKRTAGDAVKPVLTCWLGDGAAKESRELFASKGIASFETPSDAISGFMQLVRYERAQSELTRTPAARTQVEASPDVVSALINKVIAEGRDMLTAVEAKSVLKGEGIAVAQSLVAASANEAGQRASDILKSHAACVVKILSRNITHKSDVGGVRLGLESSGAAVQAAEEMLARAKLARPDATIDGFMVEPMIKRPNAHETIIGISIDPTFGPMILFGAGGVAVEVIADSALALPPLDILLAKQLVQQTRIAKLLAGYRDRPPADLEALADTLVRVSQLVIRHPEIRELDINPLLIDENGALALDARIRVADSAQAPRAPLAIRPYPAEWERRMEIESIGTVEIRPIRPEDETRYADFFSKVTKEDVHLRFFTPRTDLSHRFLARLTQIDYAREMAFVALKLESGELLGVVRLIFDPDLVNGEYAVLVRSDLKGLGLGWRLMSLIIEYARAQGASFIKGSVLTRNATMLKMAKDLGFVLHPDIEDPAVVEVTLDLKSTPA